MKNDPSSEDLRGIKDALDSCHNAPYENVVRRLQAIARFIEEQLDGRGLLVEVTHPLGLGYYTCRIRVHEPFRHDDSLFDATLGAHGYPVTLQPFKHNGVEAPSVTCHSDAQLYAAVAEIIKSPRVRTILTVLKVMRERHLA